MSDGKKFVRRNKWDFVDEKQSEERPEKKKDLMEPGEDYQRYLEESLERYWREKMQNAPERKDTNKLADTENK